MDLFDLENFILGEQRNIYFVYLFLIIIDALWLMLMLTLTWTLNFILGSEMITAGWYYRKRRRSRSRDRKCGKKMYNRCRMWHNIRLDY